MLFHSALHSWNLIMPSSVSIPIAKESLIIHTFSVALRRPIKGKLIQLQPLTLDSNRKQIGKPLKKMQLILLYLSGEDL